MKTKLLLGLLLFALTIYTGHSQIPQGFNYQAIATDGAGHPLANQTALKIEITLQTTQTGGTVLWREQHTVTTNAQGLLTLVVGTGTRMEGVTSFSNIVWEDQTVWLKTSIYYPSAWTSLGAAKVWAVPYSLVSAKANSVASGSSVKGEATDPATDALFSIVRKDGKPVFLVYPDSVRIFVPNDPVAKGSKGGFAIGGYGTASKGSVYGEDYLKVTPDLVRINIDNTPAKGSKGGFAIGGYGTASKGESNNTFFKLRTQMDATLDTVHHSPQLLWYPRKEAFLAGNVRIFSIDSVGLNSTALGYRSRAAGDYSQAFGYKAYADGDYSTSIGKRSRAGVYNSKHNAFAFGNSTVASGEDSYAFGSGAVASGPKSFAFGSVAIDSLGHALSAPTTASGTFSTAIGMGAQATNTGSLAFGNSSISSGYASLALGFYSSVESTGNYGVAIGYYAKSKGVYGQAFGLKAISQATGSMAIGPYSSTGTTANYSGSFGYSADALAPYSVAIGYNAQTPATGSSAGSFGYNANAAGPYSISIGPLTTTGSTANYAGSFGYSADALAANSVAVGYNAQTSATATSAGAFGYNAVANGPTSVAIGSGAQTGASATDAGSFGKGAIANGVGSVAVGSSAVTGASAKNAGAFGYTAAANGENSVAVGYGATSGALDASAFGKAANASGTSSMALGTNAIASGNTSVSIGYASDATNSYSVAMGYDATSSGSYSMALGYQALASNTAATSLGYNSQATGLYSTALGFNSQAMGEKSLALGSYYTYSYTRCFFNKITGLFTCHDYTGNVPNVARRAFSVAIGNGNTAEDGGIALGARNNSLSSGAIALGYLNTADTTFAFAAGSFSASHGLNAIALGENVTAESKSSIVTGAFNTTNTGYDRYNWVETDPLFVVGNGDENLGHDAIRINKNGGTYLNPENAYMGLSVTSSYSTAYTGMYAYGLISNIQRNKAGVTYYSGYFYDSGTNGTYGGEYADERTGGAIDVAEYIYDSNANTEPADVVVADPNNKESVIKSSRPYQTGVLGAISTKPHMTMGMELVIDEKTGEPLPNAKPSARLALSGRVPVKVSGENGNIVPGDYLTSSSIPGTAMKWTLLDVNEAKDFADLKRILAENEKRRNAIIGKAVESFQGTGTGKIVVLISLQ